MGSATLAIKTHFRKLQDPRMDRSKLHPLINVITIAICGVICRCEDWQQIALFGEKRIDWFAKFLSLPHGIPSHDTFERVFDRLDPKAFQRCFLDWTNVLCERLGFKHIAIDGKTLRGSGTSSGTSSGTGKLKALHLVSAWATENHLSLGQVACAEKSNEITAIPELLEILCVEGALVTIDAMGCQKEIAAAIRAKKGDYLLTVKDNQPTLKADIESSFECGLSTDFEGLDFDQIQTQDVGHGRKETRTYTIIKNPQTLTQKDQWKDLTVIGMCLCERVEGYSEANPKGFRESAEIRYFIGSRDADAKTYARGLRGHWGIENNLHWQLDVTFAEDASRVSRRNGAENLALLRKLALGLLKRHPAKLSIACKALAATLDDDFLEAVIAANVNSAKV
jgi:predicted transposase YbfD/YdcC